METTSSKYWPWIIVGLIVILYFFLSGVSVFARPFSKTKVKTELTLKFISHVFWENENRFDVFNIGFVGSDPQYYKSLTEALVGRKIRGKGIQLTAIDSLDTLANYQVLVVVAKTRLPFSEIALKARHTNTLVVSKQKNDQTHVMINLLQSADGTFSFELNRANILLEKLTFSDDILLLGGTELDVARLYGEMEEDLGLLVQKLNATQAQSEIANIAFVSFQDQLYEAQSKLLLSQSLLETVNEALDKQTRTISDQEAIIVARQSELVLVSASAQEKQELLLRSSIRISEQEEKVRQNEELLLTQQKELAGQKLSIDQQSSTIREQEQTIYFTSATLILFLILVFRIYRVSQDRKRLSMELEKRGLVLEEEVRDRTTAARESELHYRALSELSPVGVFQIDIEGNCRYVNERWCEYSGLTRRQAMGSGWVEALHPDDRKRLSADWQLHLQTEEMFNSEYRYLTPDGEIRWLLGQCDEENNADGVLQGYIGTVTDITDQKSLQEQIRRTQKMESLGMLTGGIAHDYNNMLAIISGFADLLKVELSAQPPLRKFVDQIIHASARGADLTRKLLAFSRHGPSDARLISINSIIKYQNEMLEKTLTPRIHLQLNLQEDLWPVWIDDGDLEDALVNMNINAMHAMEGEGVLTVETNNVHLTRANARNIHLPPGDYVSLSLTDTGSGMDDETKEKLFDPFFSTKGAQGTGLGLTQVYSFVERSKGHIRINSTQGEGTQIIMYFPRRVQIREEVEVKPKSVAPGFEGSETVLIADDEEALLELASEILNHQGYKTICVSNGREALEILKQTSVDLLISDVIMPEMGGYELAGIVQQMYPATKIQLVSGFNDERERQEVDEYLLKTLLLKPYEPKVLLERVRRLLDEPYPTPDQAPLRTNVLHC